MRAAAPPLGQHFLVDAEALDRLVAAAQLREGERVLDVGAGRGAIAERLCAAVGPRGRVVAVEVDPALAAALRAKGLANLEVVEGDALALALPRCDAVVANPPFRIAAPLLLRLLDAGFGRAVLVLPRELADRALAPPRTERYGKLTVQLALRAKVQRLFDVPPRAFDPPPRVRASVLRLEPRALPAGLDLAVLDAVLDAAWASRHRTLRHGLAPLAAALRISSGQVTEALRARGWSAAKPEQLSAADYADLARALAP